MKKFLIFLVAIVVVVCFGLTIFYFVRNDEVINFTTKEIYCNVGDKIYNDELGLTVKKRNKKTTYNYNAGGDEVTKSVEYDSKYGQYNVKATQGGTVTLVITTSNKKFAKFEIIVHIGDGSKENPYYISNVSDLEKIGLADEGGYELKGNNANYVLMNDISLPANFKPIAEGTSFGGTFDGQGHTISNLKVSESGKAGLFAELQNASVFNLKLKDFNLSGNFTAAGALAAKADGTTVDRVVVENGTIASVEADVAANGTVAGLIGEAVNSTITRVAVVGTKITGKQVAGGLVGSLNCSIVKATYVKDVTFDSTGATTESKIGGLVGQYVISTQKGSIQQSYAVANFGENEYHGTFIGKIDINTSTFDAAQATAQKNVYLVGNYAATKDGEQTIYAKDNKTSSLFSDLKNKVTGKDSLVGTQEDYVFYSYAIDLGDDYHEEVTEYWDADNTWKFSSRTLPELKMVNNALFNISNEFVNFSEDNYEKVGASSSDTIDQLYNILNGTSGKITKNILLASNAEYDFVNKTITNPQALENISIFGNHATIKNLTVSKYLFSSLDNCTIKNLTFENLKFTGGDAQGLFGTVTSSNENAGSLIKNVKVVYNTPVTTTAYFGGLAKTLEKGTIQDCSVEGLNATYNGTENSRLAGVVAENKGIISQVSVKDVVLKGAAYMGGIVSYNTGDIVNFSGNVKIDTLGAYAVGGVADENIGHITNGNNFNIAITVVKGTKTWSYVGGVVGVNSNDTENKKAGVVSNVTITGSITFDVQNLDELNDLYVGGVAAVNHGEITKANNKLTQVGTYGSNKTIEGKNYYVGGVTYANDGTINQVVVTSNLAGNYVAGAVVEMRAGTLNEVYIGADLTNKNRIEGDKLVAGVAVGVRVNTIVRSNNTATFNTSGENIGNVTITNVQTNSTIVGKTNSTISSLVTLIFPDGATIRTAAINNEAIGSGTLYKETWTDFDGTNEYYNLLEADGLAGRFESVVINTAHLADNLDKKQSFFNWTRWLVFGASTGYNEVNYFKYVNDAEFNNANTFRGEYTLVGDGTNADIHGGDAGERWWNKVEKSFTMQFGSEWTLNNGATLSFLNDVFAD